ncbi:MULTISPECIES: hypothetical protein [Pseudomonas]|nr:MULTISPECIES: hypothetical protein [Pseudomonas]
MSFLISQSRRPEFQDRHHKVLCPILESMMHWSWSIRGKALDNWNGTDAKALIEFIMRPPVAWVATPDCSRYSKKTRGNFADKPLDPLWRPIIRKIFSGDDPSLSSKHHRNWFITHGREYFAFTDSLPSPKSLANAYDNLEQLSDLMGIAESLTNYSEKSEPFLFIVAAALHSDIPMKALGATQTIKPTFSAFKPRDFEASDPV